MQNVQLSIKMVKKIIYLDNAATTQVDSRVLSSMLPYFSKNYGNASSSHSFGQVAKQALEKSREIIAKSINAEADEIYFTSGGTESNNWALKELFFVNSRIGKNHIITTKIEHPSILEVCKLFEKMGGKITYLNVDKEGFVNTKELENAITQETLAVSIIQGNNEIGTLQDLDSIGKICKAKGVLFHVDACQSFTKTELDVKKQNIDLMTLNSHKIHGPKGVGALFIRKGVKLESFLHGGGHEGGKRSGTENVPGIVGFAEAVKIANKKDLVNMQKNRDYIIKEILKLPKTRLNGPNGNKRLCNNINVSFTDIEGEAIASLLEQNNIFISTGSACASHTLKKSHVLKAIGRNDFEINSSIRVSISKLNKKQELSYFIVKLKEAVVSLRKISPFAK